MADQQGQIVCHFCGGCATALAGKVMTKVADLGDGFANIKFNYIDTSRVSYDKLTDPRGELFLIETKDHGAKNIHGAGGDRHGRSRDIMLNVPDYLNTNRILTIDPSIYHAVFFSASGGKLCAS